MKAIITSRGEWDADMKARFGATGNIYELPDDAQACLAELEQTCCRFTIERRADKARALRDEYYVRKGRAEEDGKQYPAIKTTLTAEEQIIISAPAEVNFIIEFQADYD